MRIMTGLALSVCMIVYSGAVYAAGPIDLAAEASVLSSYQFRGSPYNDDPVLQPSITAGYAGFSFNLWGNIDLTDFNDKEYSLNELDYTLAWTQSLPFGEFTAGAAIYSYPGVEGEETTTELMAGFESNLPLNPSLTLFRDIDKADGMYALLEAGGAIPTGTLASIDVSASLGWGSQEHNVYYYEIPGLNGVFTDAAVTIGLPFGIGETFSVAPTASYILRIDKKMRDTFDTGCFVWGLTVAGEF